MRKILLIAALLAGCNQGVNVQEPLSARPAYQPRAAQTNGAIFQDGVSFRPMFEDRRARYVGDTLTVLIAEKTQASRSGDMSAKRDAVTSMSVDNSTGALKSLTGLVGGTGFGAKANSDLSSKESAASSNLFNGSITVTVIDVLPNGNLMVAGEKRVGIDGEIETMLFSGVVNPVNIINGNTVSSVNIADARIEAKSHSNVDPMKVLGFLGRFFLSFLPFR
jgi:flagellar L-ring protein precursor FlgH